MTKLPKDVFVVLREKGTDDEYLFATTDLEEFYNGELFGLYKLNSMEKIERITTTRTVTQRKTKA